MTILVSILFAVNTFAQTETRNLIDFSKLKLSNALEVTLIQGNENKLVIITEEEASLAKVKSEVKDGVLFLEFKSKGIKKVKHKGRSVKTKLSSHITGELRIELTFMHLNEIELRGASEIKTLDVIRENELAITGSGAIEADLNVEVTSLLIDFSGASDLKLRGLADSFNLKTSGASDVKASNFIANNVVVNVSGASDVQVYAAESITGTASGASSVYVKGAPAIKTINQSGAASTSFGNNKYNNDEITITVGKQHLEIDDDDVDLKLGNKEIIVIDDGDTVRLKWGSTELLVVGDSIQINRKVKKRKRHWAGVDLAMNGFLNSSRGLDLSNDPAQVNMDPEKVTQFMELNYAKSWSFSVNFIEFYFPINKHNFGLVTGMGTEWSNYELKHNIKLNAEGGSFVYPNVDEFNKSYTWGEVDTVLDYSKNRFKTWFVNVPLLLEISTGDNARKAFHISAGAIFGFNLQTKMKYKYRLDGDTKKEKNKQSFNTNPFRVSATVRAGYGWFNVFAKYSLTPLFEKGRGPELYPFTVGVTLLGL